MAAVNKRGGNTATPSFLTEKLKEIEMKIFHFDPQTGRRGTFIHNGVYAAQTSNLKGVRCTLPHSPGTNWSVATVAKPRDGTPIEYPHPVCFCIGELTSGTDTAWHWYALLPDEK